MIFKEAQLNRHILLSYRGCFNNFFLLIINIDTGKDTAEQWRAAAGQRSCAVLLWSGFQKTEWELVLSGPRAIRVSANSSNRKGTRFHTCAYECVYVCVHMPMLWVMSLQYKRSQQFKQSINMSLSQSCAVMQAYSHTLTWRMLFDILTEDDDKTRDRVHKHGTLLKPKP